MNLIKKFCHLFLTFLYDKYYFVIKSYKIEAAHEKEKDRERQRERETERKRSFVNSKCHKTTF